MVKSDYYWDDTADDKYLEKNIALPNRHTSINWDKAKHGWTRYYDDGIITLDPDLFFRTKKKVKK